MKKPPLTWIIAQSQVATSDGGHERSVRGHYIPADEEKPKFLKRAAQAREIMARRDYQSCAPLKGKGRIPPSPTDSPLRTPTTYEG